MATMQVECLEERLRGKDRVTGKHYELLKGDRVTVSAECGKAWCAHGWVSDVSGEVPTGERKTLRKRVKPDKLTVASRTRRAK